jgi:hypothetical protein
VLPNTSLLFKRIL